ncbi:MAG: ATP phosphoribosyltransferase [Clostridia bacterium]|nr:ATP phosphoribosyltransferase [Clostridia bacterium]
MKYLTIALAKGRLAELSVKILMDLGYNCSEVLEKTRKLIFTDEEHKLKFILVKASDVATYVEYGAADIGIVGRDTILEEGRNVYEMVDLKFGKCRMCVCGPGELKGRLGEHSPLRVASKYTNIAKDYFESKDMSIELIKLNGSVELAPLTNLSDVIVDIVETGKTLYENGLDVLEEICPLSARIIVNRVSAKIERERISKIVSEMKAKVNE